MIAGGIVATILYAPGPTMAKKHVSNALEMTLRKEGHIDDLKRTDYTASRD